MRCQEKKKKWSKKKNKPKKETDKKKWINKQKQHMKNILLSLPATDDSSGIHRYTYFAIYFYCPVAYFSLLWYRSWMEKDVKNRIPLEWELSETYIRIWDRLKVRG
jgi:hypothetical protein